MKAIYVTTILMVCFFSTTAQSKKSDVLNTTQMGFFKLNTTIQEMEKACGQKLTISKNKDKYEDTIIVKIDNVPYELLFHQMADYDEKKIAEKWMLFSVSSDAIKFKTKSNLGIGSTKSEILKTYDKFSLNIYNDYLFKEKGNAKDKIQYISLTDNDFGSNIIFKTENRIVTSIKVSMYEGE